MHNQCDALATASFATRSVDAAREEAASACRVSKRPNSDRPSLSSHLESNLFNPKITVLLFAVLFAALLQSCTAAPARRSGRPLILHSSRAHFAHKQEHDRLQQQLRHQLPSSELSQHRHRHHMQARSATNMTAPKCHACYHHNFVSSALQTIKNTLDIPKMQNLTQRLKLYRSTEFPVPHPLLEHLNRTETGDHAHMPAVWTQENLPTIMTHVLHAIHHVVNSSLSYQNRTNQNAGFYREFALHEIEELIIKDIHQYAEHLHLNISQLSPDILKPHTFESDNLDHLFLGVREYVNLLRYQKEVTSKMCNGCGKSGN